MSERKRYTSEQKIMIIRELPENNIPTTRPLKSTMYMSMIFITGRKNSSIMLLLSGIHFSYILQQTETCRLQLWSCLAKDEFVFIEDWLEI